jgi:hypothetical protein
VVLSNGAANSRLRRSMAEHHEAAADARGLLAERLFAGSDGNRVARPAEAGQYQYALRSRGAESGEIPKRPVPSLVDWVTDAEN